MEKRVGKHELALLEDRAVEYRRNLDQLYKITRVGLAVIGLAQSQSPLYCVKACLVLP